MGFDLGGGAAAAVVVVRLGVQGERQRDGCGHRVDRVATGRRKVFYVFLKLKSCLLVAFFLEFLTHQPCHLSFHLIHF